jgi:hypothetical protein
LPHAIRHHQSSHKIHFLRQNKFCFACIIFSNVISLGTTKSCNFFEFVHICPSAFMAEWAVSPSFDIFRRLILSWLYQLNNYLSIVFMFRLDCFVPVLTWNCLNIPPIWA